MGFSGGLLCSSVYLVPAEDSNFGVCRSGFALVRDYYAVGSSVKSLTRPPSGTEAAICS